MFLTRTRVLLMALLWAMAAPALADDWGAIATVSGTMGMNAGRLCSAEGGRGDLGCPTYAPSLTTAGDVSVTGNLSAAKFIGDGSGLTGLAAGNVSVTTGASGSLVYRDAYGSLVASSGLSISSTTGSVGIGAGSPSWLGSNALFVSGSLSAYALYINGSSAITWGSGNTKIVGTEAPGVLTFTTSNTEAMRIVSSGYVGIGTSAPSSPLHIKSSGGSLQIWERAGVGNAMLQIGGSGAGQISFGYMNASGGYGNGISIASNTSFVGIGLGAATPSASLHVVGTGRFDSDTEVRGNVSATTVKLAESPANACTAASAGTIKFSNGRPFICRYP